MSFASAFAELVEPGIEGVYSTDPSDPGNWTGGVCGVGKLAGTKYGISAADHPTLDIANLTESDAEALYLTEHWKPLLCDSLVPALASALFKVGVNMGNRRAVRILQGSVATIQDGAMGPRTIAAIDRLPADYALTAFLGDVAYRYTEFPGFVTDGRGWLRRTILTAMQSARTT